MESLGIHSTIRIYFDAKNKNNITLYLNCLRYYFIVDEPVNTEL